MVLPPVHRARLGAGIPNNPQFVFRICCQLTGLKKYALD
jgi:hypothetical protein